MTVMSPPRLTCLASLRSFTLAPVGCFTEGVGARALQGFLVVNEAMTPEICLNACKEQGFPFAGIEFGK